MEIRRGIEMDVHKLGRLWVSMVKELHPGSDPNVSWWRAMVTQHMRFNREYVCFVAVDEAVIVGFADFKLILEPSSNKVVAVANHMYIKPEYRRKLIGRILEDACVAEMGKRGANEVVFETDNPAKWRRKGFSTVRYVMSMPIASVEKSEVAA